MILNLQIKIKVDEQLFDLESQEGVAWFICEALNKDTLQLHSNGDIGDEIGKVLEVKILPDSIPNSYLLAYDDPRDLEISAVATLFKDKKPVRWAIRRGGSCMGRTDGTFIYEPQPSSRDDEYFAEYRFDTIEDAERAYLSFHCR